jgi:hypothetical protein
MASGTVLTRRRRPGWADLPVRARAWRVAHAAWSIVQLACLGRIWLAVIDRRRTPAVWASVAMLTAEGGALVIGRGDCPVGPLQEAMGDPVPFFELVLPPRAAKAAVPMLTVVAATAIAMLLLRAPGLRFRT